MTNPIQYNSPVETVFHTVSQKEHRLSKNKHQ